MRHIFGSKMCKCVFSKDLCPLSFINDISVLLNI